jgi:hypothetical protein
LGSRLANISLGRNGLCSTKEKRCKLKCQFHSSIGSERQRFARPFHHLYSPLFSNTNLLSVGQLEIFASPDGMNFIF